MESDKVHIFKTPDELATWMLSLPEIFREEKWCWRFLNYHKSINVGCGCTKGQRIKNRDVSYLDMLQTKISTDEDVKQKIKSALNVEKVEFIWADKPQLTI